MVTVGRQRAHARLRAAPAVAALLAALAACAAGPDEARMVQAGVGRLPGVVSVDVATPTADRAAAIRVTYAASAADPAALTALAADVAQVAAGRAYPAYRLTLVPVTEPDSGLTVPGDLAQGARTARVLDDWLRVTDALLGPVTYALDGAAETITVDAGAGAAHDVAAAERLRHGSGATTWVFRTGSGTFAADGRVRRGDVRLFRAVQRSAGAEVGGRPATVASWRLDRRASHVRLDLDVALATPPASAAALTPARYERALAPLVRVSLLALDATDRPAWLSLHSPDGGRHDTFATWASGQPPAAGRDPFDRGWDAWLAAQAATV